MQLIVTNMRIAEKNWSGQDNRNILQIHEENVAVKFAKTIYDWTLYRLPVSSPSAPPFFGVTSVRNSCEVVISRLPV